MANITRFSPFDDLFGDFAKGFWLKPVAMPGGDELKIKVDVKEDDKAYTVHADIPGVSKDDIQVDIDGNGVPDPRKGKKEKEKKKGKKANPRGAFFGMGRPQRPPLGITFSP